MKCKLYILASVLAGIFTIGSAQANVPPTVLNTYEDWKVYSFAEGNQKVCFMSSQPLKQEGNFKKRGEVFFFVTHWADAKDKNVVSVSNGYSFNPGAPAVINVDNKKFELLTQEEMAWSKDQSMDDAITAALQKGSSLVVTGTSKRGTFTTDTYSLKGGAAAYQAMMKECAAKAN